MLDIRPNMKFLWVTDICENHRRYCCVILFNGSLLFDYISFSYIAFTVLYDTIRFSPYIPPYKIL